MPKKLVIYRKSCQLRSKKFNRSYVSMACYRSRLRAFNKVLLLARTHIIKMDDYADYQEGMLEEQTEEIRNQNELIEQKDGQIEEQNALIANLDEIILEQKKRLRDLTQCQK